MANRRFIDFPIAASVGDNDIVLIWQDGLNKQTTKATLFAGSPNSLAGLTDVDISALANGQILQYNSTTSKWENVDRTDIDLDELGDVTIVSPTNGQVLVYNSSTSKWENSSAGFVPYTGAVTTVNLGAQSILAGSFVKAGGTSAQFLKADGSIDSTAYGTGSVTSVALTMPTAFSVAGSPVTTAGTLAVTGAGTVGQYVRGDGSLADFPATTGGGSSVSYYLNGSVSQGTIGGVAYRELNRTPIFGAGTDITINANGYIASFITDALDPNKLLIPAGNWNFETYFSASSNGGSPSFYVELYKYDGTTFTLIASSSAAPELIAFGTNLNPYYSTLAVPQTTLALTDRLALRYYVTHSGRTITLHTENGHLCQVITTFTTGLTALNGLTAQVQFFAVGTSGTDFNIASSVDTHTFNLPTASATNRGALSSADWSIFNAKENAITAGTTAQYFRGDKTFQTLNTSVVPELTNLYYTEARVNANTNVAANTAARHNAVTLGTANGLSLSTQVLSLGLASAGVTGALSGTDWTTFNNKQNALTLTTTGTSGAATLVGSTLNIPQYQAAGTYVTGVTASSPLASSGGTTPNITIQQASGSQNGFLSSTDWTTFNNKQNALTNPVTGTGTSGQVAYFNGTTSITSESNLFWDSTNNRLGINAPSPSFSLSVVGPNGGNAISWTDNANNTGYLGIRGGGVASIGADNNLVFETGGAERMRVWTSTGNVNIGSTPASDAGFKLDVNGTGRFTGAATIGSNVAGSKLNIKSTNQQGIFSFREASNSYGLDIGMNAVTGNIMFDRVVNNVVTNFLTIDRDSTGAATFSSSITANGSLSGFQGATHNLLIDWSSESQVTTLTNTDLFFGTNAQRRITIKAAGNVGIGTANPASKLQISGSFALPHTTKSANYTLDASDYTVGFDCASNRTANLPDATTCAGRIYVIYQYNTNNGARYVTLDGNGSQTIDGVTTYSLQYYGDFSSVMIQSNGSNWVVISDALYFIPV